MFDELTGTPTWNSVTPVQQKHAFCQWQLLHGLGSNWDSMSRSWLSVLLPPGCLVYNKAESNPCLYVVLAVTPRACVVWRVKEDKSGR
eukprot:779327-Amphidinium_carterae.1